MIPLDYAGVFPLCLTRARSAQHLGNKLTSFPSPTVLSRLSLRSLSYLFFYHNTHQHGHTSSWKREIISKSEELSAITGYVENLRFGKATNMLFSTVLLLHGVQERQYGASIRFPDSPRMLKIENHLRSFLYLAIEAWKVREVHTRLFAYYRSGVHLEIN